MDGMRVSGTPVADGTLRTMENDGAQRLPQEKSDSEIGSLLDSFLSPIKTALHASAVMRPAWMMACLLHLDLNGLRLGLFVLRKMNGQHAILELG